MSLKKKAIKGFAWVFIDKCVNQLFPFIVYIYLANILTPSDFGLIGMLSVFTIFTQIFIDSGFSSGLIQKSKNSTKEDFSTVFYLNIIIAVFLYLVLFFCSSLIADFYTEPKLELLSKVLFITIILDSLWIVPQTKMIIDLNFKSITIIKIVVSIISLGVAIYMVNNDFSYWSLIGLHLSRSALMAVLFFAVSKWIPQLLISKQSINDLLAFGLKFTLSVFITRTVNNLYILLIGRYFNATQVGYFTQAQNYTNKLVSIIGSTLQGVTFPVLSSVKDDKERMIKIYKRVFEITALISIPCLFGLAGVSENFVKVFLSDEWLPIIPLMEYLSFALSLSPILWLNVAILNANKRSDLFLKINLFKLPVNILILILTIPNGLEQVAIGQIVFSVFSFFVNAYHPGKLFKFGILQQVKIVAPILIISIIMYFLVKYISLDDIRITLIVQIFSGVMIFPVLSYIVMPKFVKTQYKLLKEKWKS